MLWSLAEDRRLPRASPRRWPSALALDPRNPRRGADRLRRARIRAVADRLRDRRSWCSCSSALVILKLVGLARWRCCASCSATRPRSAATSARNRERRGLRRAVRRHAGARGGRCQARRAQGRTRPTSCCSGPTSPASLRAQAAEMNGDRRQGARLYKAMLADDRTRFVGIAGPDAAEARGRRDRHGARARQEGLRAAARQRARCCARSSTCSRRPRTGRARARR